MVGPGTVEHSNSNWIMGCLAVSMLQYGSSTHTQITEASNAYWQCMGHVTAATILA
jgi:hypothetical protein